MGKIQFDRFTLDNGLRVIVHTDTSTPLVCLNVMYDVGSRDENPDRTGFAHLFEHLMFGGSINIPNYDGPLQDAGGTNNAFTSTDITNYYISVPMQNVETAFWLESDRMLNLAFTEKSLEVQRNVVIEEFRQRYLNQPYGDAWLLLRPLAFKQHHYLWPTIGKEERHIAEATMDDVKAFFSKHYVPTNAVLVLTGNISTERAEELARKWFAPIVKGDAPVRSLPKEPLQTEARRLEVERPVPMDAIYISFHCSGKSEADFPAWDLMSDILAKGNSSRLYQRLVKEKGIFNSLGAFVTGEKDPGLFSVAGYISQGVPIEMAEQALWDELELLRTTPVTTEELKKAVHQVEAHIEFSQMSILNRAIQLAYYELLGDAELSNSEIETYRNVTPQDILGIAKANLLRERSSTLVYRAIK
ncbi:MAG: insulinase family protein [Flavobacteriales bacterium]|nr:insulinase family protein [Flavobacteriales bacterium]